MKLKFRHTLLFFVLVISFSACSKDDSNNTVNEPGSNSTGILYAKVDGIDFEADEVKAYHQGNYVIIEGSETSGNTRKEIKFLVRNLTEPRPYAIGEDGNGFIYNAKATYIESTGADSLVYYGQFIEDLSLLYVTDLNNQNISGTFEFRASDKNFINETIIDVLDGRFNITF